MPASLRIDLSSRPEPAPLPFDWGDYVIVDDPFDGPRVGYYDDDETDDTDCPRHDFDKGDPQAKDCTCDPCAVIYFTGHPIDAGPYELIPFDWIRPATSEFARRVGAPAGDAVYLVQPDPMRAPGRLKVGFSSDVGNRVRSYRTICPHAQVIAAGAGDLFTEERPLEAFALRFDSVGGEVFDVLDVDAAVKLFNKLAARHHPEQRDQN